MWGFFLKICHSINRVAEKTTPRVAECLREISEDWLRDAVEAISFPRHFEAERRNNLKAAEWVEGQLAGFAIEPHTEPPAADESVPARQVEVLVGPAETALPGTLTLPDGKGPFAAVVLVHGSGPNDRDETVGPNRPFRDLAWPCDTMG